MYDPDFFKYEFKILVAILPNISWDINSQTNIQRQTDKTDNTK